MLKRFDHVNPFGVHLKKVHQVCVCVSVCLCLSLAGSRALSLSLPPPPFLPLLLRIAHITAQHQKPLAIRRRYTLVGRMHKLVLFVFERSLLSYE